MCWDYDCHKRWLDTSGEVGCEEVYFRSKGECLPCPVSSGDGTSPFLLYVMVSPLFFVLLLVLRFKASGGGKGKPNNRSAFLHIRQQLAAERSLTRLRPA